MTAVNQKIVRKIVVDESKLLGIEYIAKPTGVKVGVKVGLKPVVKVGVKPDSTPK
jgi:hypothetical protein